MHAGLVDEPGYFLLNMTDGPYITGHPGTPQGLQALVDFLPKNRKCIWTANIVGGSLVDLAACVARLGGNIAPGIGDYPYLELGSPPNHVVIRRVAETARANGGRSLSPMTFAGCSTCRRPRELLRSLSFSGGSVGFTDQSPRCSKFSCPVHQGALVMGLMHIGCAFSRLVAKPPNCKLNTEVLHEQGLEIDTIKGRT